MNNGTAVKKCSQLLLLAALTMVSGAGYAQSNSGQDSDSARVLALETLWNQAEVAKDASALDHLLADDFIYVDIDGSLQNKTQFLDSIQHPPQQIEIIGNDTLKTHLYRDTVIVSGTYHEKGTAAGKPYFRRGRFTDTWVRQGSSWMCVASHSTQIPR